MVGGLRVTYGLRTTAEQLCQTDFETGDRSLLYLTPGIFEQKYRNSQCVKMGETKGVIGTSKISHSVWLVFLLLIPHSNVEHLNNSLVHILPSLNTAVVGLNFAKSLHCLYLCAAYLCICVPVNSQFKYLSNIPLQYRASCQTLSIRNCHKLNVFSANSRSRSLTYDKQKTIKSL